MSLRQTILGVIITGALTGNVQTAELIQMAESTTSAASIATAQGTLLRGAIRATLPTVVPLVSTYLAIAGYYETTYLAVIVRHAARTPLSPERAREITQESQGRTRLRFKTAAWICAIAGLAGLCEYLTA